MTDGQSEALADGCDTGPPVQCLFVGGPMDGRALVVRDTPEGIRIPVHHGRATLELGLHEPTPQAFGAVTYRRFLFSSDPGFVFYAVEPLGPADIMQRLCETYAEAGAVAERSVR